MTTAVEIELKELAAELVKQATSRGATAVEAVVAEGSEFSTLVRLGQVETLKEAGSKSAGIRVFFGQRAASTYSSDFSARSRRCPLPRCPAVPPCSAIIGTQ